MNSRIVLEADAESRPGDNPNQSQGPSVRWDGPIEIWFQSHLTVLAFVVVAIGFAVKLYVASRTYLNPDEALHYLLINQGSLLRAYKASLTNAHPPLIYFIVYFWRSLGHSELMLRMPSVLAGTAFCWILFKWLCSVFGRTSGMIGLVIASFAPALIALSAELRAYAVMLFCMATALYFLSRAFENKSVREMWLFSVFLYLAIFSHYSVVFFTVAIGLYALARIADTRPPRNVVLAWACGQLGALAIYAFLYVTHVSKLKNSIAAWSTPFTTAYFHMGDGNIFKFTQVNTLNIFLFLFGQRLVAEVMLLLFIIGVTGLLIRDSVQREARTLRSSRFGILLLLPFVVVWGAALIGVYPYVGSRHTVFLAPFVIAAASYLIASGTRERLWAGFIVAIVLMVGANLAGRPSEPGGNGGDDSPKAMASAIGYMEHTIPQGDIILVDYQSSLPITYYLCGPSTIIPIDTFSGDYFEFKCHGYSIISLHIWKVIAPYFADQFQKMARDHQLKPGTRVWFYQTGWGETLDTDLPAEKRKYRCLAPKNFGGDIAVIPFIVDADFQPSTASGC